MNNSSLYRIGGIAAIFGIVLVFAGYAIPVLLGIGMLLFGLFYYALDRFLGSSPLGLAAVGSTVVGAIGLLFTGTTPTVIFNIFTVLAFMLPALLAGLAARSKAGFPRVLPIIGIVGGSLGIVNAIVNIAGGGDYTNLSSPALTLLSKDLLSGVSTRGGLAGVGRHPAAAGQGRDPAQPGVATAPLG